MKEDLKTLIIISIISGAVLLIAYMVGWERLGYVSTIISLVSTGFSVSIWRLLKSKEKFNEQRIKILLKTPTEPFELPYEIERKNLTRSELQGLLGILPIKEGEGRKATDRYQLSFLNTPAFFANLKAAQDNKDTTSMEIICYEYEVAQFDIEKMRVQCTPLTSEIS